MDVIEEDYLSIPEVSERMGISQKLVRKHIASNKLKSVRIEGIYKIPVASLVDLVSEIRGKDEDVSVRSSKVLINFKHVGKEKISWVGIEKHWEAPIASNLTFVDVFSGAGGLTKGFEMAGLQPICGIDWFHEAGNTFRRNFNHSFVEGDIRNEDTKSLFYDTVAKQLNGRALNIVAGGFPCQGFSLSGNRIVDDPRNSLYKELLEIVSFLKPEFVVCENVVGLRSMLNGKVEEKILRDFRKAGYKMNVTVLRAADYGVPQKRDRVIFIGNRIGCKNFHPQPFIPEHRYVTTGEAIGDLMNVARNPAFNHIPTKHHPEMVARLEALEEGKSLYKGYADSWKRCCWSEPSSTIKENHGGVNVHPKLPRVLTAREMARLQSFPDDFIFEGPKNKQLVQIGNAVPPLLAKAVALAIRKSYNEL